MVFAVCPFSGTRQSHCRVFYRAHGKIKLPRRPSMPREQFIMCHMVRHMANNGTFVVCHVDKHTAKNGSFVVCLAMAHGKKWWHTAKLIFRFFFCLITNILDSNQINITVNSYILHQMSRSFHISQFASHSIHRIPNANIANIAMHTSPNVVDTSPYKHW